MDESPISRPTNAVEEAVFEVFKGIAKAAEHTGFTRQMIWVWLGKKMLTTRESARRWEAATAKAGRPIPAAELLALVPWRPGRGVPTTTGRSTVTGAVKRLPRSEVPAGASTLMGRPSRTRKNRGVFKVVGDRAA